MSLGCRWRKARRAVCLAFTGALSGLLKALLPLGGISDGIARLAVRGEHRDTSLRAIGLTRVIGILPELGFAEESVQPRTKQLAADNLAFERQVVVPFLQCLDLSFKRGNLPTGHIIAEPIAAGACQQRADAKDDKIRFRDFTFFLVLGIGYYIGFVL
jgi:hypothetical protein